MNNEQKRQLKGGVHLDVQHSNGTCYDLIAMLDPYGGVLIAWSITGWLYRYYPKNKGEIKQLGRDGCRNNDDMAAIKQIIDNWFDGVKQ